MSSSETPDAPRRPAAWADRFLRISYQYPDRLDQQRAQLLLTFSWLVAAAALAVTLTIIALTGAGIFDTQPEAILLNLIINGSLVLLPPLIGYWLNRGAIRAVSVVYVFGLLGVIAGQYIPLGVQPEAAALFVLPVLFAAFLLPWRLVLATAAASLLLLMATGARGWPDQIWMLNGQIVTAAQILPSFLAVIVGYILLTFLAVRVSVILQEYARSAQRYERQLQAVSIVGQTAASSPNVSELMRVAVDGIRDAYGFYHAQVFLLDEERRSARLEASTGRAGEDLLRRGHALPVGSRSVVGQCTSSGTYVVVNDTLKSETHRPNPLLPDTRAELALPLLIGQQVIGAIDVQSVLPEAFQPEDIRSLQVIADQLAIAINKAALLDELRTSVEENIQLLESSQGNLRDIEALNRQLTREGWVQYLRLRRLNAGLGYTLRRGQIFQDDEWTATMGQAYQAEQSVVVRQDRDGHIAAVPLRVRNEVIGVLEIERTQRPWSDYELDLLEALVERVALAIENARLYEQATLAIGREQSVNRISQEIQTAAGIDEVLQTALSELSTLLGAARGVVQIAPRAAGQAAALADSGKGG